MNLPHFSTYRFSYAFILLLIVLGGTTSCFNEPEYPDTPQIDFKSLENIQSEEFSQADSVIVTLSFQDGNGDLGLSQRDTIPPFQILNEDGTTNRFHFNYFLEVEIQNENGDFVPLQFSSQTFTLNGRFPRLNTLDKETALEGDLRFSFILFTTAFSPVQNGDVIRYNVQIVDRDLNESNIITTEPMLVGSREE